jgi:Ca2+-binding RTX toxin-like protein
VLVTVFALAAFQVLAVISAGSALAVTDCNHFPSDNHIECTIDPGNTLALAVEGTVLDLDPLAGPGAILQSVNGGAWEAIGSATNATTTRIEVLGSNGSNEVFTINNNVAGVAPTSAEFNTAITWAIDLGTGASDLFQILAGLNADTVVLTDTTFTLNGGGGPVLGMEFVDVQGFAGGDTIDGSGMTAAAGSFLNGGDGNDVILPGAAGNAGTAQGDFVFGGLGDDTLSYQGRTTGVTISNVTFTAGRDANANGNACDPGDECDVLFDPFEILQGGSGNDRLDGAGLVETFVPGDGDDTINGQVGDWLDWSSSSAGMVIDVPNLTATGQGTDHWVGVDRFIGSAFDDTALVTGDAPGVGIVEFFGGAGVDTVDASTAAAGVDINLDILDPSGGDDLENVIGSEFTDELSGNDLRNDINALGGDDFLDGQPGNDTLTGGPGNDTFSGGSGADKISYATNTTAGVEVDMNLGFATSADSGDDGFAGPGVDVEIVQGSPFNDQITGGGGLTTINFLFTGGNGKDTLTGSGSNDTLKGGAGNDRLRGLEGGDTLKGGKGSNDRGWGGPGVDFCTGVEREKGCE